MSSERERQLSSVRGDMPGESAGAPVTPGVHIMHERPAPETEPHVIAPLVIALANGERITVRKWSLAGVRDTVLDGADLNGARLCIPFQGIDIAFPVRFALSAEGKLWAFEGLTGRQREALGLFYRNLLTGKMAATDEVITALDTPVDLIPMGETDEEKAAGRAKAKPRILRAIWNVAYYVGLFAVIVGVLGSAAWKRLDHVALTNARYVAPIDAIAAPAAGFVAEVAAAAGTSVAAGDLLIRLSNPEGAAGLAEVRGAIALVEARLEAAVARLATHMRRAPIERAQAADMVAFDAGLSQRPGDFHDIRERLEQEIRLIELELRALRSERGRLRDAQRALEIRAPTDGRVDRVLVPEGSFQRVGTPLIEFEADTARTVIGWIDGTEAAHLWQGMRATVHYAVAGERRSLPARIARIEAGADPLRPDAYGLMVHLELPGLDLHEARALLPHNAAVEVRLHRDLLDRWFGAWFGTRG